MASRTDQTYTEHVTEVITEDREHPGIGTVAVLTFSAADGSTRPATLGPRSMQNVAHALAEALERAESGAIVAIAMTGSGRVFLAGADLTMFSDPDAVHIIDDVTALAHRLQVRMRRSHVPVLAHLNGAALGGGLEVALMADMRTAGPKVRGIGLPETSLGILPGWGGTTILPSVVGAENAVRRILEDPARDRQLSAVQAHEVGLVDALADDLDAALEVFVGWIAAHDSHADGRDGWHDRPSPVAEAGSGRGADLAAALDAPHSPAESRRAWAARLAAAGAPSVERTIAVLDALPGSSFEDALDRERETIVALAGTDAAAGSLYAAELLRRGKPGRTPVEGAREINRIGVAGAGLMASQIAAQLALGMRVPVVLRDLDREIAERGLGHARGVIEKASAKGKLSADDAREVAALLSATDSVDDLADCDMVLEAVPEVLAVKQKVFAELEGVIADDALLVTNTSSLSVAAMSAGLAHPERVVGLHFFNPVAQMPLVEVIRTEGASAPDASGASAGAVTNAVTLATGREIVRRCGKFAVECADAPGFVVNRLLFRVLSTVLASIDAGADPQVVDASLDPMGMPMRPLALLDLVGPGVADHVGKVLAEELDPVRFPVSPGLERMIERGGAFTRREDGHVHPVVTAGVREAFGASGASADGASARGAAPATTGTLRAVPAPLVGEELLTAVLDGLADECARMLDEGVVERPEQIDLAMILGAGFPRYRGGLTPYLDQSGAAERAAGRSFHGDRFKH